MVEFLTVTQISCHIQSPSVYIVRSGNPFFANLKDLVVKLSGSLIVQLRQCIMGPPAIVGWVIRPAVLIIEIKIVSVGAVCRNISTLWISLLVLIDPLSVHPFIERATVIKYTIQDHLHAAFMNLIYQMGKQFIAGFQILLICHTLDKLLRMCILAVPFIQKPTLYILHDLAVMRIHVLIILNIILVVAWGNEDRVQVNNIHAQILKVIQLIQNTLQVSAVELSYAHNCRNLAPVTDS